MSKSIFVNLPVADLKASMAFYEAIGFTNNPDFTDDTAACMVWSEVIYVMLLTHDKWKTFTDRSIPSTTSSEVMLCFNLDSRAEVDAINRLAGEHGGTADINPSLDHGFMFSRFFSDLDGHVWEPLWMDPAAIPPSSQDETGQGAST
ncbi:VOC family protein [Crateriforma spongiae]|uniref:VOC family protein n=1 Tax=Crateriforma spongiae TaxID=2724528 RepID=UPI00144571A4|nr:lactoylglutathione lyase [Crateriforma spongiae]